MYFRTALNKLGDVAKVDSERVSRLGLSVAIPENKGVFRSAPSSRGASSIAFCNDGDVREGGEMYIKPFFM